MLGKDIEKHIESLSPASRPSSSSASSMSSTTSRENWGVIPRAVESLFEELRLIGRQGAAAIVHCSYMQIYNNEVFDLLQENKSRMKEPLAVRELIKGNGKQIYVSGLSEFRVANLDETLKLLKLGNRNRTIRATEYNEKSSRSHALLQISAEVESRGVEGATTIIRRAKLNLVDLAGSEKWATDAVMGAERCKELTAINQSLSALGNVISALTNPKRTHIPYRDSKLTRLLQDSLGGNTRTVVIATISPSETALDETISTLLFADRAKCVLMRVKVNEMVDDAILLARAQREIARLKVLLKQNTSQMQVTELEEQNARLTRENAALVLENKKLRKKLTAGCGSQSSGPVATGKDNNLVTLEGGSTRDLEPTTGQAHAASERNTQPSSKQRSKQVHSVDSTSSASTKTGSLQLNKLRLDLMGSSANAVSVTGKLRVIAAFVDDTENDDDVRARLGGVEQEHEQVLRDIQTERRDLEQKLELLSQQQGAALVTDSTSSNNTSDDESCPMCGRNIDDHSDAALDLCIEKEEMEMRTKQQVSVLEDPGGGGNQHDLTSAEGERGLFQPVEAYGDSEKQPGGHLLGPLGATIPVRKPDTAAEPTTARSTAAATTPRRLSTSAAGGRPSPYLQDLGLKPSTPSSLQSKSKSFTKRRNLREGSSTLATRSNSRSLKATTATSHPASSSIEKTSEGSNQIDSHSPSSAENEIPILRQGHKSVKALKKFHAMSPYNLKLLKRTATDKKQSTTAGNSSNTALQSESQRRRSEENPNCPTLTDKSPVTNTVVVTNSVRDIGLKLTVYKFRYDCWYPCTVVGYDGKRKLHCCQFEYGDKQWQDLKERKVQVVGRVGDPSEDSD